jgi:transposase
MDEFRLSEVEQRHLVEALRHAHDVRLYRRTLAVLECGRGKGVIEVAKTLNVTRQSVFNWLRRYRLSHEMTKLADAPKSGRPPVGGKRLDPLVEGLMALPPERLGYHATHWTIPLLHDQVQKNLGQPCSTKVVRNSLHRLGYRWKRPRYVLAPDPQRAEKKGSH